MALFARARFLLSSKQKKNMLTIDYALKSLQAVLCNEESDSAVSWSLLRNGSFIIFDPHQYQKQATQQTEQKVKLENLKLLKSAIMPKSQQELNDWSIKFINAYAQLVTLPPPTASNIVNVSQANANEEYVQDISKYEVNTLIQEMGYIVAPPFNKNFGNSSLSKASNKLPSTLGGFRKYGSLFMYCAPFEAQPTRTSANFVGIAHSKLLDDIANPEIVHSFLHPTHAASKS